MSQKSRLRKYRHESHNLKVFSNSHFTIEPIKNEQFIFSLFSMVAFPLFFFYNILHYDLASTLIVSGPIFAAIYLYFCKYLVEVLNLPKYRYENGELFINHKNMDKKIFKKNKTINIQKNTWIYKTVYGPQIKFEIFLSSSKSSYSFFICDSEDEMDEIIDLISKKRTINILNEDSFIAEKKRLRSEKFKDMFRDD